MNNISSHKIKVLIVDDSALIRAILTEIINQTDDLEVIGVARDPLIAREKIRELKPDVITLDIEMPNMDGLEFLEKLMRLHPLPVLMVSTLTQKGSESTLRALELGAIDFIAKPKVDVKNQLEAYAEEITSKLRMIAKAKISSKQIAHKHSAKTKTLKIGIDKSSPGKTNSSKLATNQKILVIGASTGGTEAIKDVLMEMPADCPPILIVQHMPPGFTKSYAARLDSLCAITVREAAHGERILSGHAYLAPGDYHLSIGRVSNYYICNVTQDPEVNRHRPAVDVLFNSVATLAKGNAVGVILTGMGKDGAAGMKRMYDKGCKNLAQDEASCVVFGMPKEAIAQGGVDEIVPLDEMAERVLAHLGYE
jgi:two-component system, chemotaxis family, protein-glutamate methylesterase/glutaminase